MFQSPSKPELGASAAAMMSQCLLRALLPRAPLRALAVEWGASMHCSSTALDAAAYLRKHEISVSR